jgi:pyruvate-formate lyase-activating enzyme
MRLEQIGFYTLSDSRAIHLSPHSPMWRCELIITDKCNFQCPYCRGVRAECSGVMPTAKVIEYTGLWADDGLKNIRYSGGEPTLHPGIKDIVSYAKEIGIERIALSTNGSSPFSLYKDLIERGANDFSISLDACCASRADIMAGTNSKFDIIAENIRLISALTYVTVGIVITEDNVEQTNEIVEFAHELGVADIRIISAAQYNSLLTSVTQIPDSILSQHPILKYRVENIKAGRNVRGLGESDCDKCYLLYDDSIIAGDYHFPCVIHFREGGKAIGKVGPTMREDRIKFFKTHNTQLDPICKKNCLDVCIDHNNCCSRLSQAEVTK